jgi:hypothetical protein
MADLEAACACAYEESSHLLWGHCALQGLKEAVAADPTVGRSAVAEIAPVVAEVVRARAVTLKQRV